MGEIEIWENLLKWCFVQQNVINDPKKWSKEDMITKIEDYARLSLQFDFVTLNLHTKFFFKVYCYKDMILPQDLLIYDLLEFHILPDLKSRINLPPSRKQILIDQIVFSSFFASWIDKKDYSHYDKKILIPHYFKLLYRSSQDGIDTSFFHKNCDDKGVTIWIVKIKNLT
jgi:hypothetical protein